MGAKEEIQRLLEEHGAVLERDKRHEVWRLPNGQKFTRSKTPSDRFADDNSLGDLKRALGLNKTIATVGERRDKRRARGKILQATIFKKTINTALSDELRIAGVSEDLLKEKIEALRTRNERLEQERNLWRNQVESCLICRVRIWWKNRN